MTVAVVALVFSVGGFAIAAGPVDTKGNIHGCYAKKGGKLRVIKATKSCKAGTEKKLNWAKAQPKSLPPKGAAGGDLTGSYPAPTIKPGAVTTAKMNVTDTTVPVDITSLSNKGQCYERAVSVPGAQVGDVVTFNVPANFADQVSINSDGVSEAGSVTLRFCVGQAATVPIDPVAGDWRFILFH